MPNELSKYWADTKRKLKGLARKWSFNLSVLGVSSLVVVLLLSVWQINAQNFKYKQEIFAQKAPNEIIIQQGLDEYAKVFDATLDAIIARGNLGNLNTLYVNADNTRGSLIKFDLSGISSKTKIESAILELFLLDNKTGQNTKIKTYEMARLWKDDETSWANALKTQPWGIEGANMIGTDIKAPLLTGKEISKDRVWYSMDITDNAQSWIFNPFSNYGLALKGDGSASTELIFASSNNSALEYHPRLRIIVKNISQTTGQSSQSNDTMEVSDETDRQDPSQTGSKSKPKLVIPIVSDIQEWFYRFTTYNNKLLDLQNKNGK